MIIEIALGIVLAVVILWLLAVFAEVILWLVLIAIGLGIVGLAIFLAVTYPGKFWGVVWAVVFLGAVFWVVNWIETKFKSRRSTPQLDPTTSPTTNRLRQDDAERASGTQPQDSDAFRRGIAIKARWLGMSPKGRSQLAVGIGTLVVACLLAVFVWLLIFATSDELVVVTSAAVAVGVAALLFGPLFALDWIRARKKKMPPESS
jgi:energy-coupling factor transporter transmembrane protein EcfT